MNVRVCTDYFLKLSNVVHVITRLQFQAMPYEQNPSILTLCALGIIYKFVQHLDAVNLPFCLLRYALSAILGCAANGLCVPVEACVALGVLMATSERLLAVDGASGVGVRAGSVCVCGIGLAAAYEVVEEGVGVLACAL